MSMNAYVHIGSVSLTKVCRVPRCENNSSVVGICLPPQRKTRERVYVYLVIGYAPVKKHPRNGVSACAFFFTLVVQCDLALRTTHVLRWRVACEVALLYTQRVDAHLNGVNDLRQLVHALSCVVGVHVRVLGAKVAPLEAIHGAEIAFLPAVSVSARCWLIRFACKSMTSCTNGPNH